MKTPTRLHWFSILTALILMVSACGTSNNPAPPNPPLPPVLTLDFGAPLSLAMGGTVPAAAQTAFIGDFDQDGNLDFAILNDTIGVFLGNGDGSFGTRQDANTSLMGPQALSGGDLDGSDPIELVGMYPGTNQVDVFFDLDMDGIFQGDVTFDAGLGGETPQGVTVADFTQDGILDLMFTESNGNIYLKVNDGMVAFNNFSFLSGGALNGPRNLVAADFNQDGAEDIAVANFGGDFATVWLSTGDANPAFLFQPADADNSLTLPPVSGAQGIAAGDLNDDGFPDVIVPSPGTSQVAVFLNQGDGSFAPADLYPAGADAFAAAVADFDLDGNQDFVVANAFGEDATNGDFSIYLGDGSGQFAEPQFFSAGDDGMGMSNRPRSVAVGDFNNDTLPDVLLASSTTNQAVVVLNTSN